MLRRFFIVLTALVGLAAFGAFQKSPAQAQRADTSGTNASSPACPQVAWSCADVTDLDEGLAGRAHRQNLKQSGLPTTDSNGNPIQFYIACGINTDEGFLLTTGNTSTDKKLCLGEDTYSKLQNNYDYVFDRNGTQLPITTNTGSIDVTVKPYNYGASRHHMCMIGWVLDVTTTGNDGGSTNTATQQTHGLEYTTFTFPIGQASCTTVYADPYGRTYNSDLKPVPNASVSIHDFDSKNIINLPGVPNPVTTKEDGIFNFNIPPGRSFLRSTLTNLLEVHPNYTLAYTEPYRYGDVIVETLGNAEQRDIAVQGGSNPVLKVMGYTNVRTGDHILVQGSASWPLTIVDVMQGSTSITQMQSDKFGSFEFRLDPTSIDPTQEVKVKLTEVDLTIDPNTTAANPATDEVVFDPIPSYLEGYAYDSNGQLVPFATVRVRLKVSDGIYFETRADAEGFYSVAPRNLPILPYYLEILEPNVLPTTGAPGTSVTPSQAGTTPGVTPGTGTQSGTGGTGGAAPGTVAGSHVITIPEYARQNKEYHDVEVIDIMSGTKNGTKVDPLAVADSSSAVYGEDRNDDSMMEGSTDNEVSTQDGQARLMTLAVMVVILIFVVTGAVLLIRKKNRDGMGGGNVFEKEPSQDPEDRGQISEDRA